MNKFHCWAKNYCLTLALSTQNPPRGTLFWKNSALFETGTFTSSNGTNLWKCPISLLCNYCKRKFRFCILSKVEYRHTSKPIFLRDDNISEGNILLQKKDSRKKINKSTSPHRFWSRPVTRNQICEIRHLKVTYILYTFSFYKSFLYYKKGKLHYK